jgi:hypothetical protein
MAQHRSVDLPFVPLGSHTTNSSLSSAVTLTPATGATMLMIQSTGQNVRYTLDGTVPTASVGFRLTPGDGAVILPISPTSVVKVIQEAASGTVGYQWGRL